MTIGGIVFSVFGIAVIFCAAWVWADVSSSKILPWLMALLLSGGLLMGMFWYYNNTASGRRAMVDQQTELANGLERTINIYTANGDLIATYEGKIDLEDNAGGYVLFDYEGHRYTYYNCFIESIAEID